MQPETPHDLKKLSLDLVELLLAPGGIDQSLLEADGDAVQVLDLADHLVGRVSELAEATLFREGAVTALRHIPLAELLCLPNSVERADAGDGAVVLVRDAARDFGETEA